MVDILLSYLNLRKSGNLARKFNNFSDTIFDKYNRTGYLIKRESYYIFQPFDENEDVPMYYRKTFNINNSKII